MALMARPRPVIPFGVLVGALLVAAPGISWAQNRATITGSVTDATGALRSAIPLVLTSAATGIDRPASSGLDGTYTFGGLLPGEYRLRINDDRFAPWSQEHIVLSPGERRTIGIVLQPRVQQGQRATISGTVLGPNGRPLAGAVVVLTGPGGDRRATTDAAGAYAFSDLPPGTFRARVTVADALAYDSGNVTLAAGERRLVDVHLQPLPPPPQPPQPRGQPPAVQPAQTQPPAPATGPGAPLLEAMPDRWQFEGPSYRRYQPAQGMPWVVGHPFDPYNQNAAKGDFPVGGDTFLNLNLQFNSQLAPGEVAAGSPGGGTKQLVYNQNAVIGAELFGGDTVFQPRRWAARFTSVMNLNAKAVGRFSFGALARKPVKFAVEELFGEKRLAVLGPAFDFVSLRGGMQNFNSDFRGYLFVDNQLGVRLFGNAHSNRHQYNVAYFSMRDRDATSQLHDITKRTGQDVLIANYFITDFATPGYTFMVNFHLNRDRRTGQADTAGTLSVFYLGVHGDGHWGDWSVSHAFYQAFGHDNDNALAPVLRRSAALTINGRMAAIELARDSDAKRIRTSFFYASGDRGNDASKAGGFDMITDNPNLAGGQFMFWTQQAIKVPALPGVLSEKFSLLPNLRGKFTDRANFLNPGLILVNVGFDVRASPKLKLVTNGSYLRFADVSVLQQLTSAATFPDAQIGLDLSLGFKWRPAVNENLFVLGGAAILLPRGGFATAVNSTRPLSSLFATIQVAF